MNWPIEAYRAAAQLVFTAARPWLSRKYKGKGFQERLGYYNDDFINMLRCRGRPLWIHSVSVGEVQSASSLVRQARDHVARPIVMSTITSTGRTMAEELLNEQIDRLLYYPWDAPSIVSRAVSTVRPKIYVTVETEVWPAMLAELRRRSIPSFMVNGRFSDRTFEKMCRVKNFWSSVLDLYSLMMVRSDDDRSKLIHIGVNPDKIIVTGDCKVDSLLERHDLVDLSQWEYIVGDKKGPIVLAGSTHDGEEKIVLDAFKEVQKVYDDARLIIVPRHPERASSVVSIAGDVAPACTLSDFSPNWKILVVDRIGVLFPLYGISDVAFIGGSLVPRGGQNIMEPVSFGVPICQGPYFDDFVEATDELKALDVCHIVHDSVSMADRFLRDIERARGGQVDMNCKKYFKDIGSSAAKTWRILGQYI